MKHFLTTNLILQRAAAVVITLTPPFATVAAETAQLKAPTHGIKEVGYQHVRLRSGFWGPRLETHHHTTVPHVLDQMERTGHITNFDVAAGVSDEPLKGHHAFDSDLHKALEGALYSLQQTDDPALRKRIEDILDRILATQMDDGYLITYYAVKDPAKRWTDLRTEHEMYNAGHFFELAVEHHRQTGQTKALDAARRFADHIDAIFGPGKRYDTGGHEEIELALVKLYRITGESRYLDLCRFLLDERGHAHGTAREPFTPGPQIVPEREPGQTDEEYRRAKWRARLYWRNGRMQDHKPLVEQTEAVGHAVRAGYVYSAMADIARFSNAPEYARAVRTLWKDVVSRKIYLTGGIGTAQYGDEGFGDPYLLPNKTYCESCSSIANILWQHRMNLLDAEGRYADVMELVLYNAALSGISLSGDRFFYQNPLESRNGSERSEWIGLACCPTNHARFTPQVGGLVYAHGDGRLYVNLYAAGEATVVLGDGTEVKLSQQTEYPWHGRVSLKVAPGTPAEFDLRLRLPGWVRGHPVPSDLYRNASGDTAPVAVTVNGEPVDVTPGKDGYLSINRRWEDDVVVLELPMPVRRVYSHPKVGGNRGKVALMRGPVVYCLEGIDQPDVDLFEVTLPSDSALTASHRPDLLGGVTVVETTGRDADGKPVRLTAIPYHAWANREKTPMSLWIHEAARDASH